MNNYEVMYIVKPVEEEAFEALVAKFDNLINNNGGTVEKTDRWGKKRLAFVVWGKIAEFCGNSLTTGQRALVDGRLQIRSYDAKDGTKRWVTEVIANSVEFIERKATGSGAPVQSGDAGPKSEMESFGSAVPFDEEIPF